ncbi:MAG: Fe-S protein assembly co-chaperone HscB [Rickettsiaceae bacterium]
MNYFDLLDLEQSYELDQSLVRKQYLLKQAEYHPDRANTELEKKNRLEKAMLINEAYKVLSDDYKRAEYLLSIKGVELNDRILNSRLSTEELEVILEQHEIIAEMEALPDLKATEQSKLKEKSLLLQELGQAFRANNLAKALDLTIRLKYLTNLVGNIKLKIKHANNRD